MVFRNRLNALIAHCARLTFAFTSSRHQVNPAFKAYHVSLRLVLWIPPATRRYKKVNELFDPTSLGVAVTQPGEVLTTTL